MSLKVVVEYRSGEDLLEQVFHLSYGGMAEYEGDYDYEYSQAMAEFTNSHLDNPTLFLSLFLSDGAAGLFEEPFAKAAFSKAIYEQGLAAFLDGAEIPEAEELEILTSALSWAVTSGSYDYKDMSLCSRIYQVMGPLARAEVDVEVDDDIHSDTYTERRAAINQTLRINNAGDYIDIITWAAIAKKTITNPLTFEYEFEIEADFEVSEDIKDMCRCLGVHPPDDDFAQDSVPDPFEPFLDYNGKFVLLYTEAKKPVSPSSAEAVYRFRDREDAVQAVDVSTTILWQSKRSKEYKMTLAEIISPDVKHEIASSKRQVPMFESEAHMGQALRHDMLRHLCTWVFRHVNPGPDGWQWVKIDHENDDEVVTENEDVFS